MARLLFYLMEAPRTRLLGLAALQYTPSLLEVEVDLRVIVEEPFGNLLDVECIVVEVMDLLPDIRAARMNRSGYRLSAETS
jgi:hypothetical protein